MGAMWLAVEKILGLRVDIDPGKPLVAAAEVEFRVAVIEIAIGQEQATHSVGILALKVSGVVTAAGECRGKNSGIRLLE